MLYFLGCVFSSLYRVRALVFVVLLGAFVFTVPGQIRELYRIVAEQLPVLETTSFVLFLFAAPLILAFLTDCLSHEMDFRCTSHNLNMLFDEWLPWVLAAVFPAAVGAGILYSREDAPVPSDFSLAFLNLNSDLHRLLVSNQEINSRLAIMAIVSFLAFVLVLSIPLLRRTQLLLRLVNKSGWQKLGVRKQIALVMAPPSLLIGLILLFPMTVSRYIGSLAIILVWLILLGFVIASLTVLANKTRLPIILPLVFLAVGLSLFDINDNHQVEQFKYEKTLNFGKLSGLEFEHSVFLNWLAKRQDLDDHVDRPYPVFVVAAAGGGHYAAEHTATVLSRIQDRCPSFGQHVFAISGVSGGSLGAAIFSGLTRNKTFATNGGYKPCLKGSTRVGELENRVKLFFNSSHDLLSPLVAKTLFHDLFQRFWPIPHSFLDRSRALDEGFSSVWDLSVPEESNYFNSGFLELWDPASASPALLLNTTNVDTGARVVIAPFKIQNASAPGDIGFHYNAGYVPALFGSPEDKFRGYDIALKSAVGISARFPWMLPVASVKRHVSSQVNYSERTQLFYTQKKLRLVDGGYFENSGSETAFDVVRQLARYFEDRNYLEENLCAEIAHNLSEKSPVSDESLSPAQRLCRHIKRKANALDELRKKKLTNACNQIKLEEFKGKYLADDLLLLEQKCPRYSLGQFGRDRFCDEFARLMGTLCDDQIVSVHVINIGIGEAIGTPPSRTAELFSPINAMLKARQRRGHQTSYRLNLERVPCADEFEFISTCDHSKFMRFSLNPGFGLPLGWRLSDNSRKLVDITSGHAGKVSQFAIRIGYEDARSDQASEYFEDSQDAACTVQLVLDELSKDRRSCRTDS